MNHPTQGTRLAALFVAALLGALTAVGVTVASLGWVALGPYLAAVAALLLVLVRRARVLRAPAPSSGHTCTCCTSTVYDPVEVR